MTEEDFREQQAAWWHRTMLRLYPEPSPKRVYDRGRAPKGLERGRWYSCESMVGLPSLPGVYVVILDGRAIYVGQSENIRLRFISQHRVKRTGNIVKTPWGELPVKDTLRIKFKISRRMGDWAMWEVRLIKRLRPEFNVRLKPLVPLAFLAPIASLSGRRSP